MASKATRTILAECTVRIEIGLIRPSPDNPRKSFPKEEIAQLASTLADTGPDQDIVVRPIGENAEWDGATWKGVESYEIIDGDRRHRAAKVRGLKSLQCKVRHLTDDEAADARLISFAQRSDLLPSELATAYMLRSSGGKSAEQIAKGVGKPLSFVRSLLRLAKLPSWALAAVDRAILPRATAELIARVPGSEGRSQVAGCVLNGATHPGMLDATWTDKTWQELVDEFTDTHRDRVLSYRDVRSLIHQHFTRELKSAPFDRKSLDLVPEAGSCDLCPSRAGNDEEATAEGIRADCCLNPECFRSKEDAYRKQVTEKAATANILPADLDVEGFDKPPRGWCRVDEAISGTELSGDFLGYQGDTLTKKLGKALPQKHLAWGKGGKAVYLVKTAEARKALIEAKILKKVDRKAAQEEPEQAGKPEPVQDPKWKKEQQERKQKAELGKAAAQVAITQLVEAFEAEEGTLPSAERLRALVAGAVDAIWADATQLVLTRRGLEVDGDEQPRDVINSLAAKLEANALFILLAELIAARQAVTWGNESFEQNDKGFWAAFDIDRVKLMREAKKEKAHAAA